MIQAFNMFCFTACTAGKNSHNSLATVDRATVFDAYDEHFRFHSLVPFVEYLGRICWKLLYLIVIRIRIVVKLESGIEPRIISSPTRGNFRGPGSHRSAGADRPRFARCAPPVQFRAYLPRGKRKNQQEAGFFFYCGDGRNWTAVHMTPLYVSTMDSHF